MNSVRLNEYYQKRRKCVAIASRNGSIYYAISGEDGPKSNKFAREIERMLGSKNHNRCFIQNSFTVLKFINKNSSYYKLLEDYIYNCLNNCDEAVFVFPEYLGTSIPFKSFMQQNRQWYPMTNYSCVERKIIGAIKNKSIEIVVGLRPCYICLPAIKNVTYYDQMDNAIHSVCVHKRNNRFHFFKTF